MHSDASVLIFTPTWIDPQTGEDAIRPEVEEMIKAQQGVDFDWHVGTDNPYPIANERGLPELRNVLHQYQQAREYFLHGKWDRLLTIEHDNLLPDDAAIARLLDTPGDVVYAPYLLRHGQKMLSTWQYINDRNLGMSLTNYKTELRQARAEIVHRVSGTGFGCTLITRRVVEAVEFSGPVPRDPNPCPDLRFSEDCLRKGFVSYGRFDVPILHFENGEWLHPFQTRKNAVDKYIALETVRSFAAGRIVQLTKGGEIELTQEEALELVRVGYISSADIPEQLRPQPVPPSAPVIQAAEIPSEVAVSSAKSTKRARRKV